MRFLELIESQPPGQTFYHVTTANRLKSIQATGLEPGRHRRWKNPYGRTLGDRGYLYLISNFSEAVRFAARQDYQHRINKKNWQSIILVLHNVPTEGLKMDHNIEGQLAGNSWWQTTAAIAPENIVRVIPLTPDLIRQVVQAGSVSEPA